MDVLKLLAEAKAAGLRVRAVGDKLVINGPKEAEPIVEKLGAHKAAVMAALTQPPAACKRCGCALGWRTADGRVACAQCKLKPPTAEMLILVDTEDGPGWRRYDDERPVDVQLVKGPDPWDEAVPWDDSTPSCPKCKSAEGWTDALDRWHCWKCEPPFRTEKLLNDRERILREAWQRSRRRPGGKER
jgi:predicted Zn-ribbon and HTH transcriptional regulator